MFYLQNDNKLHLVKLQSLYFLLSNGFNFENDGTNNLKVTAPQSADNKVKTFAKNFIADNKIFILSLILFQLMQNISFATRERILFL